MSDAIPGAAETVDRDKQRLRVWLRLLKIQRQMETEIRERLRLDYATTLPRFDVLAALYREEKGLKMSELSTALMVSNGNVTGIVERLVSDGLVVRVPVSGDRRAMLVRLTERGREFFAEMARTHEGWVSTVLSSLSDDETDQLFQLLDSVTISGGVSQ